MKAKTISHYSISIGLLIIVLVSVNALGELQHIQVGGAIVFYGDATRNLYTDGSGLRYPPHWLLGMPVNAGQGNIDGLYSWAAWDTESADEAQITSWTRLHINAVFSDSVSSFTEFEYLESWGESLRSEYLTGRDFRALPDSQVGLYQGYIEIDEVYGTPLQLRIGRQELVFGNEWLVGNNTVGSSPDFGLSFDALCATYTNDLFTVDLFAAKLAERLGGFTQDDTDFYGLYATWGGVENHTIDAYWLWLRDDAPLDDLPEGVASRWMQRMAGVNQYDTTNLHTVGLRFSGAFGQADYEVEGAYQFGDAGQVGALFQPATYGDDDANFDTCGLNTEVGYTFNVSWQPRIYLAYAYLGGEDNRDISFRQWLRYMVDPFYTAPASVSFNRLFSNKTYTYVLDATDMSNVHVLTLGTTIVPHDKLEFGFWLTWLQSVAAFHRPVTPYLSFLNKENSKDLGIEAGVEATYYYTNDLYLSVGWSHLFTDKGLEQGNFNSSNGLDFDGGTAQKDADYLYFEMGLSF